MDGRSKSWRRKIEDMVDEANARHVAEVWIVYQVAESGSDAGTRKKSWSSDNREVALVSMCLARNHLPVKPRADPDSHAGESSTHYTTYTGVEPMTYPAMQLVSLADKEKIFGFPPEMPRVKSTAAPRASPLLWQDRKTPAFWGSFLTDLEAKAVFDLTPGAGSCGRACLNLGILYACLAKNQDHSWWLQNVLDRAAVTSICELESALFNQDLATCIKEHLQDVVDQVNERDEKLTKDDGDESDDYDFTVE